jgi:hypothetical protein
MKKITIFFYLVFLLSINFAAASPKINFEQALIQEELNPQNVVNAKAEAIKLNLPLSIVTTDMIRADVKLTENGKPVYAVITNFANVYDGGYTAFYEEIESKINFANAKIDYGNGHIVDNTGGYFNPVLSDSRGILQYLMITESGFDRVYLFNAANGDLVDTAFIPHTNPQLSTPKHALQTINSEEIFVSDQIADVVQRFNVFGTYLNIFAPAGGVNNNILDNIRGIAYRPNNNLLVTVGSGASTNTVQQFDIAGNPLGAFISAGLNSPFDVLVRHNDVLVSNFSGTNRISQCDLSGNYLSSFYTGSSFALPEQMYQLPNGNVIAAAFSTPSGIAILDSSGAFLRLINAVTGNRGINILGNGHYITTNGAGVHEIDSATGGLVRTIVASTGFQYISSYQASDYLLSLKINFEACTMQDTISVELRNSSSPYNLVESQTGIGGLGIAGTVRFSSAANGTPYYIVVKHRNSIATWSGRTPQFVGSNVSYDFTSGAAQAFGNNMVDVGGMWSLYTGDVNQDGVVDLTDEGLIDNDAYNFTSGYVVTDLNCDGIVDITDESYADNNAFNFVGVIAP